MAPRDLFASFKASLSVNEVRLFKTISFKMLISYHKKCFFNRMNYAIINNEVKPDCRCGESSLYEVHHIVPNHFRTPSYVFRPPIQLKACAHNANPECQSQQHSRPQQTKYSYEETNITEILISLPCKNEKGERPLFSFFFKPMLSILSMNVAVILDRSRRREPLVLHWLR